MVCEHLYPLEQALLAAGIAETYRGQPWSRNCREWVYFDADLDTLVRLETIVDAGRFPQQRINAPSRVTIVTAQQIEA